MIASTPVNGRRATADHEGEGIQGSFDLSNFQDGCLPAAFMAGLLVSAPIFVHYSATIEPFKLVGIGLMMWFVSVFACGLSWDFWSLLICRTLVGVGEASFIILAAPFINHYAPVHLRSRWLSIFLMANPVGYAVGYIYGAIVGTMFGWRGAFMSAACLMLPFAAFAFQTKPVPLGKDAIANRNIPQAPPGSPSESTLYSDSLDDAAALAAAMPPSPPSLPDKSKPHLHLAAFMERQGAAFTQRDDRKPEPWELGGTGGYSDGYTSDLDDGMLEDDVPGEDAGMRRQTLWLLRRPIFTLAVLGFTLHTALFGVLAYWGPKAITFMFRMQDGSADVIFGGITVATGIFGTLVGGSLLDATGGAGPRPRFAAARVCLLSVAIGAVFLQAAFVFGHSMVVFAVFFALGELVLFLLQAPVTVMILLESPPHLQPLAFSLQTISIHVLGDVPSPPIAGLVHDYIFQRDDYAHPDSWRYTCIVVNCVLVGAVGLFLAAALLTRKDGSPDGPGIESASSYVSSCAPIPVRRRGAVTVPILALPPPLPSPRRRRGAAAASPGDPTLFELDEDGALSARGGRPIDPAVFFVGGLGAAGPDPATMFFLDRDDRMSAMEEGGSSAASSASPTYRTASSMGSHLVPSDTSTVEG